jgi:ATP-dependent RNA helicase DeaD
VEAVMNYDIPDKNEYYLHRIGRTGRAKKAGVSFSFAGFVDRMRLDEIFKYIDAHPTHLAFDTFGTLRYQGSDEPFFEHA